MTNNDLISRSALKAELMKRAVSCPKSHIRAYGSCISALEVSPAVDAEPVRHGKWLFSDYDYFTCSVCGGQYFTGADSTKDAKAMLENNAYYPYCPYCGAKMDGGNEDG